MFNILCSMCFNLCVSVLFRYVVVRGDGSITLWSKSKDCLKPRCIYSLYAISHMKPPLPPTIEGKFTTSNQPRSIYEHHLYRTMARDKLHDATESPIFVCGMTPMDQNDPCYNFFHCDPSFDCTAHIEAKFAYHKNSAYAC